MRPVNVEKLRVMRKEWDQVLQQRSKTVGRLKQDLEKLRAAGKNPEVDAVIAFYDQVLLAGKACGRVDALDDLIKSLTKGSVKLKLEGEPGDDPRLVVDDNQEFRL